MGRDAKFEALLQERGAQMGAWLGVPVVDDYGDVAQERLFATGEVPNAFGIADRSSRGTLVATGSEVVPLLQGVVTSDVFALAEPGTGQHSSAVNSTGRLVCEMRLLHGPDILIMDFEPGVVESGIISHFRANVMTEDAKFLDRSTRTSVIGVYGADAVLSAVGDWLRPPGSLPTHHGTWGSIGAADVVVRRTELGLELLVDLADAVDVWTRLEAAGGRPVGERALEMLRIEAGFPRWGAELDEKVIPLEGGLNHTVAFDKGCYVGQEIIARLDTRGTPARLLRTLELDAPVAPGSAVFDGDRNVGEVRSAVDASRLGTPIALAYVKRDYNDIGHVVQVGEERIPARVRALR